MEIASHNGIETSFREIYVRQQHVSRLVSSSTAESRKSRVAKTKQAQNIK